MISFIIPTLNEEKAIEKTIMGLRAYSGEKEIIISDSGSIDRTIEIARSLGCISVRHDMNVKPSIALGRNTGAKVARGEFLIFLDADVDVPDIERFCNKIILCFRNDWRLAAMAPRIRISPENATRIDNIIYWCFDWLNYFYNNIAGIGGAGGECQIFRNDAFKKVGGYNENLVAGEDYDIFRRIIKHGSTKILMDLTIYHTGRRIHKVGWPRLLSMWIANDISNQLRGRSLSKKWEEIR